MNNKNIIYLWFPPKDYEIGGMYAHVKGIISGFLDNGYYVTLITSSKNIPLQHQNLNIEYIYNNSKLPYPFNMKELSSKAISLILREINELNPEFIYHRYELFIDVFEKLKKLEIKTPLVLEYNGSYVWMIKHWSTKSLKIIFAKLFLFLFREFEKNQLNCSERIIVVSNAQKKEILADYKITESKIISVTNGYNPETFYNKEKSEKLLRKYNFNNKKIIGFSGTFGPWHGADVLAKAVKEIVSKTNDVGFLFIGDGILKNECEKIVLDTNVSDFCIFTGKIPFTEMNDYLNLCDVLVNPTIENKDGSEFFGSPTKLFEYVGTEKTIVTSNIGQMKDLFSNEEVYFTNPGDVKDLAAKILIALKSPKAVKNKEKYAWKGIAKQIIECGK